MTAPLGNLGAEIETGGKSGLGQSDPRLAGKLVADWFAPSSRNQATGFATAAPSFRSSWQAVFDAWHGVSRGTNSINNLQEEIGTNAETNGTESAQTPNKLQTAFLPPFSAGSQSMHSPAPPNASAAAQIATSRPQLSSGQDAIDLSHESTAPDRTGLPDANHPRRMDSRSAQQNTAAQPAKANSQALTTPTAETVWLPIPQVSVPAVAASIAQTQIAMGAVASSETGERPPFSESNSALPGLRSAQILKAIEFAHQGTGEAHTSRASSGAPNLPADSVSLAGSATGGHGASSSSFDDLSEPAAVHAGLNRQSPAADAQSESKTVADGNPTGHSGSFAGTGNFTNSEISTSGTASAVSRARSSGTEKATEDATQTISPGHSAEGVQGHSTAREAAATVAPAVQTQPATPDVTNAVLRAPAVPNARQPLAGAAPITSASSPASAQDTFTALDRETSLGAPTWTHAAGQHAEAGFRDPDLGWVGVRADLDSGGIHATLVPSSADAAQTLSGHLAGLSSHLADEHAPVASLAMAAPGESGADSGVGQRMQQGTDGNAQGNRPDETSATPQKNATVENCMSTLASTPEHGFSSETRAYPGDVRGTHISVIA